MQKIILSSDLTNAHKYNKMKFSLSDWQRLKINYLELESMDRNQNPYPPENIQEYFGIVLMEAIFPMWFKKSLKLATSDKSPFSNWS